MGRVGKCRNGRSPYGNLRESASTRMLRDICFHGFILHGVKEPSAARMRAKWIRIMMIWPHSIPHTPCAVSRHTECAAYFVLRFRLAVV